MTTIYQINWMIDWIEHKWALDRVNGFLMKSARIPISDFICIHGKIHKIVNWFMSMKHGTSPICPAPISIRMIQRKSFCTATIRICFWHHWFKWKEVWPFCQLFADPRNSFATLNFLNFIKGFALKCHSICTQFAFRNHRFNAVDDENTRKIGATMLVTRFFLCCRVFVQLNAIYSVPLSFVSIAYFDRGSYNLFFVDWSELARAPCYPSAVHNTKYAGECIGQLVNRIRDAGSENIHIIGFSLGAHVGKTYTVCSNNTRKLCDFINYEPSADWYVLAGLSKCVIDIYDSQIRQAYIRSHKVTFISWRNLLNTTQSDNIHLPHEFCFNYCFFLSINIWFLSFFMEWDFYCAMIKVKNKMLVNCLQLWKNDKAEQSSNSIYI